MKLVLASQGFTTPDIVSATAQLVSKQPKDINVAIINEAYVGIKPAEGHRWLIDEVSDIARHFGGIIEFVNLRAYSADEILERLAFVDIIYIVGGKQLMLTKLFKQCGLWNALPKLAQDKVIFGTSAGANVLGKQIPSAEYWQDQYSDVERYLGPGSELMELVDFNILPHYGREDHPRRRTDILEPLLNNNPFKVYGVTDEQAVFHDNGRTYFVGGDPVVFGKD